MTLLFVFAFISLLITGMQLTWPGRYRGQYEKGNRGGKKKTNREDR